MNKENLSQIKFDNKAIDKIKVEDLDFSYINKAGENKFRRKIYIPFDVPTKSSLKGLKLVVQKDTGSKLFWMNLWFESKSIIYPVGKFVSGVFGTKEVEDKLLPIVRSHTNDKAHWIKNPNTTEKESERVIKKEDIKATERKTVNDGIEALMKADMPKIASEGTLCAKSIREQSRLLIGYNKRTRFLSYSDNEHGNGHISFKPNYKTNSPAPDSWSALFDKYPSGSGLIKDKKKNKNSQVALYDNQDYGKQHIDEFDKKQIQNYINLLGGTYSYKKGCLTAIKTLWNFCNDQGWLNNIDTDPTQTIKIKRPTKYSDLAVNTTYNDKSFSLKQLATIHEKLQELSEEYPFASENVQLVFLTGQRQEETYKLKKKDLEWWKDPVHVQLDNGTTETIYGKINFRKGITKRRNKGKFYLINQDIKELLNRIESIYKRPGYENYKLIPHLFPSPSRISKQRLNSQESAYIKSNLTRLRSTKGLWDKVRTETGILGVVRMARKTLISLGKDAGLTNKQLKPLSNHDQERTMDINYDKSQLPEIMKACGTVAQILRFPKKKAS